MRRHAGRGQMKPILLCACLASLSAASDPPLAVTAVRHWSLGEVTRVAIETNGEFEYRYDRIPNPDRIFFDVLGTQPRLGNKILHVVPVGDGLIKQIRVAGNSATVTRIVLDLSGPMEFTASQL